MKSFYSSNTNVLHYTHPSHRIHTDIKPVLSALKYGKKRIAELRFQSLCLKLNLMYWESIVVSNLIRETSIKNNIYFP